MIDLTVYTITGHVQVRFIVDENNGMDTYDDFAIDDIYFDEFPTYLEPKLLTVSSITDNTTSFTWTATLL